MSRILPKSLDCQWNKKKVYASDISTSHLFLNSFSHQYQSTITIWWLPPVIQQVIPQTLMKYFLLQTSDTNLADFDRICLHQWYWMPTIDHPLTYCFRHYSNNKFQAQREYRIKGSFVITETEFILPLQKEWDKLVLKAKKMYIFTCVNVRCCSRIHDKLIF